MKTFSVPLERLGWPAIIRSSTDSKAVVRTSYIANDICLTHNVGYSIRRKRTGGSLPIVIAKPKGPIKRIGWSRENK